MKKILSLTFLLMFYFISFCYALDPQTHKDINEYIAYNTLGSFSLDLYLKNQLGLQNGKNEILNFKYVWKWMGEGGVKEDVPYWYMLYRRSVNHFHNPLEENIADAGFSGIWGTKIFSGESSILWSQKPSGNQNPGGHYSWHDVRDYFYTALTATDNATRESNFAETFRGLGQMMHLVEDLSVPEHARDDGHYFPAYEEWVANTDNVNIDPENDIIIKETSYPPIFFDIVALQNASEFPEALVPIANLFDTNQYDGSNPDITMRSDIGLSEYTNANFVSGDTIFSDKFPYPSRNAGVAIQEQNIPDPLSPGNTVKRPYYIKTGKGDSGYRLAGVGYLHLFRESQGIEEEEIEVIPPMDDYVFEDYAKKLIPRAVGYSAGLLDYFFRGQIEVLSLRPFSENDGLGLRVKIKNVTPTQEAMIKGDEEPFSLIWRYTPEGANPDGSEDKFSTSTYYTCREGNCDEIQYEDEVVIDFYFYWEEAEEIYQLAENQINCMLVFKGTLGSEESAVIGKNISPGNGQIESACLPLFSDDASYGLRLRIKNVTPTQEAMIKGDEEPFDLVCRFTPEGANPDGSEDKYVSSGANYYCREGNCDEIQYGDKVTIDFYLPWEEENRIGVQIYESAEDSVKCMLVFKGELGEEETAVVWKYFTLGQDQIRFNEEWDNGLTGNHPWQHTQPDDPQNPDNGTTSNVIVSTDTSSNSLIKDNVRYAGYSQGRFNETFVDFNDEITPYTYLQFKIDDLSITGTSAQHWQAMLLYFNEGRILQMTQSGQGNAINGTTATYTFTLGANMNLNIFEMFQDAGISIPDPFYIESIDFIQQLFQESPPPDTETSQHMEIDYIRIIEEKQEE